MTLPSPKNLNAHVTSEIGLRQLELCRSVFIKSRRYTGYGTLVLWPLGFTILALTGFTPWRAFLVFCAPIALHTCMLFACLGWRTAVLLFFFTRYTLLQLVISIFILGLIGLWVHQSWNRDPTLPVVTLVAMGIFLFGWVHLYDPETQDFGEESKPGPTPPL